MAGIRDIKKPSRAMARHLERMGRKGDTILAHINPKEAALLKRRGGAGTRNPKTGLLEFYDAEGSSPDGSSNTTDGYSGSSDGGGGGGGNDPSYGAGTTGIPAAPAAPNKTPEQEAAEAAEKAAHQARLARSYANPMAHIAGGGAGYQGNLDSYRPNYYAYGPSPTMQFGADFQTPQPTGGLENALGRIYGGATGQAPTEQSAQNWEGQLRAGMSPGDFRRLLVSSPAGWDEGQYLAANPDVAAAVRSGSMQSGNQHFQTYGQYEARPGSGQELTPLTGGWNENAYLAANPDVAAAVKGGDFQTGFDHYNQYGRNEKRGGFGWNEASYLSANPDVAAAVQRGEFGTGFDHYNQYGRSEGRFAGGGLATLPNAQRYPARFSR